MAARRLEHARKGDVALHARFAYARDADRPPAITPSARKYDAPDASPSTTKVPGLVYSPRDDAERLLSRSTSTPKRDMSRSVSVT